MSLIEVINVGQGNCIIIKPECNCRFTQKELIFDLGNGQTDVCRHLSTTLHKEVFLSHYHKDHIGGLCELMVNYGDKIDNIWLPFYQNEIIMIAKSILKLKGMKSISNEYKEYFENMLSFHSLLKRTNKNIQFISSGQFICNHLEVFNPVVDIETSYKPPKNSIQQVVDLFEEPFQQQIKMYLEFDSDYIPDAPELYKHIINPQQQTTASNSKRSFVYSFFFNNLSVMHSFNSNPTVSSLNKIKSRHILTSHQACSVLRYQQILSSRQVLRYKQDNLSCLLPGDADLTVMKRLVNNNEDIKSTYLILPHHGSKNNISKEILQYIEPHVAIISHDNAKFGRSKDTHPNCKVLDMLKAQGVHIISTNDIIKGGKTVFNSFYENYNDTYIRLL